MPNSRSSVKIGLVLLLVLFFILPSKAQTAEQEDLKSALFKAEKDKRWKDALQLGQNIKVKFKELETHVLHLSETIDALKAAETYNQSGLYKEAQDILKKIYEKLEKGEDKFLVLAVKEKIETIETTLYGPARKESEAKVNLGFQLINSQNYDEAIKNFESIIKADKNDVTDQVRRKAKQGKIQAETLKLKSASPKIIDEIKHSLAKGLRTVVVLLAYFAFAIIAFYILRWIYKILCRRTGIGVSLEDHTAPANEREGKNQTLSQELVYTIRKIASGGIGGIRSEDIMDLDAANLPSIHTSLGGIANISPHIDTEPIKVGPISFTPKQLFSYLTLLFKPRHKNSLVGVLTCHDDQTVLRIEQRKHHKTFPGSQLFESVVKGNDKAARTTALKDVAAQILVTLAQSIVTSDWRSLRSYLDAEELLDQEEINPAREKLLKEAYKKLISSLRYDPANWMARFKIATVQRKLGENRPANEQFEYIERMLKSEELWKSRHFEEFLKKQPEFIWIVRYNRAIALSKQGKKSANDRGLKFIEALIQKAERKLASTSNVETVSTDPSFKSDDDVPKPPSHETVEKKETTGRKRAKKRDTLESAISISQARRLLILLRSARAAANCMKMELLRKGLTGRKEDPDSKKIKTQMKTLFQAIEQDEEWLWNYVKDVTTGDWQAYAQAHAIAQNARGRAYFLQKDYKGAIPFLEWAIRIHMPSNFIEPYINLAEVYINQMSGLAIDWSTKAEDHLSQALRISPENQKANCLMGILLARPEVGRHDEAIAYLDKAGEDPECYFLKAKVQIEQKKNTDEGIKSLQRSIYIDSTPDSRFVYFINLVIDLAKVNKADDDLILNAQQMAETMQNSGKNTDLKKLGADFVKQLSKYLKKIKKPK